MILVTLLIDGKIAAALQLKRDPILLRFVSAKSSTRFDALDLLDDSPKIEETVRVGRRVKTGEVHLLCARGARIPSGWYRTAEYELLTPQPEQAILRTRPTWEAWATEWWAANKPVASSEDKR